MSFTEVLAEPVTATIFAVAQALGGNVGAAVIVVTVLARLAMLPLGLALGRRSILHRRAMEKIRPELEALRERFAKKPEKMMQESGKLFEKHGVKPIDGGGLLGALAQAPLFLALWTAAREVGKAGGRFLWIGDLARPDLWLTALAALVSGLGATAAAVDGQEVPRIVMVLPVVFTLIFLWKASAGVGLYWASSSAVGWAQGALLRRWAEKNPSAENTKVERKRSPGARSRG